MDNQHYICEGSCAGISDKPGVCQAEVCEKKQQPLTPCVCEQPEHQTDQKPEEDK